MEKEDLERRIARLEEKIHKMEEEDLERRINQMFKDATVKARLFQAALDAAIQNTPPRRLT